MRIKPRLLLIAALPALLLVACGDDGTETEATGGREVAVTMKGLKYEPASVDVQAGDTVTFVFTNDDTVRHDAFIGDEAAQADHESEMAAAAASGDHDGGHDMDSSDAIVVEPGKTGELTHTFEEAGTLLIGCHEPGHYAGGMKMTVTAT